MVDVRPVRSLDHAVVDGRHPDPLRLIPIRRGEDEHRGAIGGTGGAHLPIGWLRRDRHITGGLTHENEGVRIGSPSLGDVGLAVGGKDHDGGKVVVDDVHEHRRKADAVIGGIGTPNHVPDRRAMEALLGGVVDGMDDDRLGDVPGVGGEPERRGLRGGGRMGGELTRADHKIDQHVRGGALPQRDGVGVIITRLAHRGRSAGLDDQPSGPGRILDGDDVRIEIEIDLSGTGLVPAAEVELRLEDGACAPRAEDGVDPAAGHVVEAEDTVDPRRDVSHEPLELAPR